MSRGNHANNTAPTTTSTGRARHLHTVPAPSDAASAPSAEDKVRSALTDHPGSTTATLATAAGVGRSTAAKILARWDRDGVAHRTPGDAPRDPDTWALAPPTDNAVATEPDAAEPSPATAHHVDDTNPAARAVDGTAAPDTHAPVGVTIADDGTADHNGDDTTAGPLAPTSSDDNGEATTETRDEPSSPSTDTGTDGVGEPDTAQAAPEPPGTVTARASDTVSAAPEANRAAAMPPGQDRLPKGGLRALVEEYLTNHPTVSFGPAQIGKDLGRSGGAVNNACEKLVADGYATQTCLAPKRFAINPDKVDVPAHAANNS